MFLRISKEGMPFSAGNIRIVRIIGILFLVNAVIPSVVTGAVITPFSIPNYTALIEGLLFLFIAHIIRYGATEWKLWRILLTSFSILLCIVLFIINAVITLQI